MYKNEKHSLKIKELTKEHHNRMENSINLIASENITSTIVREAMASDFPTDMLRAFRDVDFMKDANM